MTDNTDKNTISVENMIEVFIAINDRQLANYRNRCYATIIILWVGSSSILLAIATIAQLLGIN